ncbi:hypothetical protein FT641_19400 [Bacillus paranthracis]|uniref:hypothetical protein n=1 Tax=Bacillus paranthracis TaxID=2026186 RepID=UPI00187A3B9F|nr:hypothetical protein [Bacillus paranthracis]MBE7114268.1 hypothetical protein [Bacillus paranthracis]MBE7154859.1 hypothetical protein [Bacillus paranthracis]
MRGKLIGHQVDNLVTVQYETEEDRVAGLLEFKAKGFDALEPFERAGVYTVSYTKKEIRNVNRAAELEGEPLFWSLNGSFATMKELRKLIEDGKIKTLNELYLYGDKHLEMLRKDMAKFSPLPVTSKGNGEGKE